jgi:predicted Zn-dependent peptidase
MIININSKNDLSGFYVIYNGSTNIEKKGWYGLSHLMEHLLFKCFDSLQDEFDRDCIDYNAYTSPNEIVFYITGLNEKINKWKYKYVELLSEFHITKEQFETERKVVLEEYTDSFNDQCNSHYYNIYRKIFNKCGAIGLKEDLMNLKYMDIIKFWELQFSNPSKIINVSKDNKYKNNLIDFSDNKDKNKLKYGNYNIDMELENNYKDKSSIIILSKVIEKDFNYIRFINLMLNFGLNSPLYKELREKRGLIYGCRYTIDNINDEGVNVFSTITSNNNYKEVVDVFGDIIKNPDKYLTKERMGIIKDYYTIKQKEDDILRYERINKWIDSEKWDVYKILKTINMNKIREIYDKYYKFDNLYISNDKTEFSKNNSKIK